MQSLWDDRKASEFSDSDLHLRTYTSNIIGQSQNLVLHGGGNTSVKIKEKNFFGEEEEFLYVKGSGWDLKSIRPEGFSPVKQETLLKLARLQSLTDTDMVREQKAAMKNPSAPSPSVEAILHAIIPFKFVDHTHADAVVTLTNVLGEIDQVEKILGKRLLYIPYVMPGFILARKVFELTQDVDWSQYEGMVLMNHGVFTFSDSAKESYERMISIVTQAEDYLAKEGVEIKEIGSAEFEASQLSEDELLKVARLRKQVSQIRGKAMLCRVHSSGPFKKFAHSENPIQKAQVGPITPDHVIHTKPWPLGFSGEPEADLNQFVNDYNKYYENNKQEGLKILDAAPRWAVWPQKAVLSFGDNPKRLQVISDINLHTVEAIAAGEKLSSWKALPRKDLFECEYWELEQAKLKKAGKPSESEGKVAIVTGAASGIGKAIAEELMSQGVSVCAIDLNPKVQSLFDRPNSFGALIDMTDSIALKRTIEETVQRFGGVDIVISNAGIFPPGKHIDELSDSEWDKSLAVNLTSAKQLLKFCTPYLKQGVNPSVVFIASKNVPAPGPGASAYSVAKAGLTQLARVAALELGPFGIPVNVLHPNAVFDTGIWTEEVLQNRAKHYGLSVEEYKKNNVLKAEVTSQDVAKLAFAMTGPLFSRTTAAQVPIDGGNERVI